jgi:hypothetical protein
VIPPSSHGRKVLLKIKENQPGKPIIISFEEMSSCIFNLSRENVRNKLKKRKARRRKEKMRKTTMMRTTPRRKRRKRRRKGKRFDIRYTFYIDQNTIFFPQPFFT